MGTHLNSSGDLTKSQREHADSIGISRDEFRECIKDRLIELKGGVTPTVRTKEMKKDHIIATKPVLVIGAGPSYKKNYKMASKFEGIIVAVDNNGNDLMRNGVIPDYIVTLEQGHPNVTLYMFDPLLMKENKEKVKVVGSAITRNDIREHIVASGVSYIQYKMDGEARASNVGIFALNFARYYLKADKIIMIGFEHSGQKYPSETYLTWQVDFWYFVKKWPKETIVNCTDDGALYYNDWIIDTTLDRLKIETPVS